ncbi:MAG: DUF975 family protein [Bacteroidales bacterium]|nr:DUF975 family protein [Bacteroidales bacterium]
MKSCSEYRSSAAAALKGNWASAVIATIIIAAIVSICSGTGFLGGLLGGDDATAAGTGGGGSIILTILVLVPASVGYLNALKKLHREGDSNVISNTFSLGFKNYVHQIWTMLLMAIYISLWTLLLVIPGIVKSFSYAMTPFILHDEPDLGADATIHRSREMMYGHKADLFLLDLSFIGWYILGCITLGIGLLWVYPYVYTAHAAFYEDVKAEWEMKRLAAPLQ